MLDKLQAICNKYEELSAKSEQPDFYADPQKAAKLLREKNDLEPIVEAFHAYNQAQQDMADAQELMADPEMKELCQETYAAAKAQKEALAEKIQILLLPKDPNDEKNVIMEIRGGVGGEESALFAHSLLRMYSMYAAKMGWSIELMNLNETELGGVKEADFIVSGRGAYSRLKYESSGSPRRNPAAVSTPPLQPSRFCRRWRKWTCRSTPPTLKCRSTVPAARAVSTSTKPPPPCG